MSVAVSPDGSHLIVCDKNGNIFLRNGLESASQLTLLKTLDSHGRVVMSKDGNLLGISSGISLPHEAENGTNRLLVLELSSGNQITDIVTSSPISSFAFSQNFQHSAIACKDDGVELYRITDPKRLWADESTKVYDGCLQFSLNNQWLLVVNKNEELIVYDVLTGAVACRRSLAHRCRALAVSPNGKTIVTGGTFATQIWRLKEQPLFETTTPPFFIHSMKLSPDGSRLLTASPNGQIRFWDIANGILEDVGRFTLHERVRKIAFSPDGKSLITASEEGWVRVWPFSIDRDLPAPNHTVSKLE